VMCGLVMVLVKTAGAHYRLILAARALFG
jgi:hypothetical protein